MNFNTLIITLKQKISKEKIKELAEATYQSMFKLAVDIQRGLIAAGGEFHADGEQLLITDGSEQKNIWGANFYPFNGPHDRLEYSALINIRPQAGNKSMNVEDPAVRKKMKEIIERLLFGEKDEIT